MAAFAILAALLGGGGIFAYQVMSVVPKQALADYVQKVSANRSAHHTGTFTERDDGQQTTLVSSGRYDISDADNPRFILNSQYKSGSDKYSQDYLVVDKMLFVKTTSSAARTASLASSDQWYKLDLGEESAGELCDNAWHVGPGLQTQESGISSVVKALAVKPPVLEPKLVALSESLEGKRVRHYRGRIDVKALPSLVESYNENLPAACQLDLDEAAVAGLDINYDLWTSGSFDRLRLTIADREHDVNYDLIYDSFDYGRPVDIKAPEGAKSLFGGSLNTKDIERKEDARRIVSYLTKWATSNKGLHPASAAAAKVAFVKLEPDLGNKYSFLAGKYVKPSTDPETDDIGTCPVVKSDTFTVIYTPSPNRRDYRLGVCLEGSSEVAVIK